MSISRASREQIPVGAIILTEDQIKQQQVQKLKSYKPLHEVLCLKYGSATLGLLSCISGLYIMKHFRAQMLLKHEGRFSTYIPTCMIPAIGSHMAHFEAVTVNILIEEEDCSACLETRAAAIQTASGVIWPLILAPLASCVFASSLKIFPIPHVTRDPKGFFKLMVEQFKPGLNLFGRLAVLQATAACLITFRESYEYVTFRTRCELKDELKEK